MPVPLKDVYEELQFTSDRISTQTRTIALSVLALVWLFLAGGTSKPTLPVQPDRGSLLITGALALGSLLLDYLQYVLGYFATNAVRAKTEDASLTEAEYDYKDIRYRARKVCFWAKQVAALVGLGYLAYAVVGALLKACPPAA
jgi:hypothetical protein